MQLSHVAAFWLRLAGNILLDLFLYVHMFCSPVARTRLYDESANLKRDYGDDRVNCPKTLLWPFSN